MTVQMSKATQEYFHLSPTKLVPGVRRFLKMPLWAPATETLLLVPPNTDTIIPSSSTKIKAELQEQHYAPQSGSLIPINKERESCAVGLRMLPLLEIIPITGQKWVQYTGLPFAFPPQTAKLPCQFVRSYKSYMAKLGQHLSGIFLCRRFYCQLLQFPW